MGDSNLDCAVSKMPINSGEKVMCIFIEKNADSSGRSAFTPYTDWTFASLPFEVTMDDCSCPKTNDDGTFQISSQVDKEIYDEFVSHLHSYTIEDKAKIKSAETPSWYHTMRYHRYDNKYVGYCRGHERDFNPVDVNVMFIKLDVYKFITSKSGDYRVEDWLQQVDNHKLHFKDIANQLNGEGGYPKPKTTAEKNVIYDKRYDLNMSPEANRFRFISWYIVKPYMKKMMASEYSVNDDSKIREKFKHLYCMTENLHAAQVAICPSLCMSPQGGMYSDHGYIKTFYNEMSNIYDKQMRDLNL